MADREKGYNSAASHLVVKRASGDGDQRIIEGIATTPTPDHVGDIINPMGAKYTLPLPLLFSHDHAKPIGRVEHAEPTKAGIKFRARIVSISEPGVLKDRVDEAWQSIKAGIINACSIGFKGLQQKPLNGGGWLFDEWNWLELSICTIPMNPEALITSRRSLELMLDTAEKSHRVVRLDERSYRAAGLEPPPGLKRRAVVVKLGRTGS